MADTVKSSSELRLNAGFKDEDTRMIVIDNPRADLSLADVQAFESAIQNDQPIVGDKGGAQFEKFLSAKIVNKTKYILDLS